MDWKVFCASFTAIFFAELADKTQLVGMGMSAKSAKPWVVLFGSIAAYTVVTVISVFLGAAMANCIKPELIKYAGALIFIAIGILMFLGIV